MTKEDDKLALLWWEKLSPDDKRATHKKSRWGHLPYEVFDKYTVLIRSTYRAQHGDSKHDSH